MSSIVTPTSDYDILIYGDRVIDKNTSQPLKKQQNKRSSPNNMTPKQNFPKSAASHNPKYVGDIILKKTNIEESSRKAPLKSVGELNDEILELKRKLAAVKAENTALKTKGRHLEEDKKQIEDVLREAKNVAQPSSVGPDGGKYKTWRLKNLLREKEDKITELESNLKLVNNRELKDQVEVYYSECLRLRQIIADLNDTPDELKHQEKSDLLEKLSQSQLNLIRMSKSYQESKQTAQAAREEAERYSKEIRRLGHQMKKLENEAKFNQKIDATPNALLLYGVGDDLQTKFTKKIRLRGSLEERVVALQEREIHLLRKIHEMHEITRRIVLMKESEKQERTTGEDLAEKETKFAEYVDDKDLEMELSKKISNFTRKRASVVIQRNWRRHRASTIKQMEIIAFNKKCAAKKIYKFLSNASSDNRAKVIKLLRKGFRQQEDGCTCLHFV